MRFISEEPQLGYMDVFIVPQYSEITSRKKVFTKTHLYDQEFNIPVMSANMDTVTNAELAIAMYDNGGIGALHRFMSIEENVKEYNKVRLGQAKCFVSVGVNDDSKERAQALYDAGARHFIIDIAHGHSLLMRKMIQWLRTRYKDEIVILAGNIATEQALFDLIDWGANAVKVGIGPGCFAAGTRILMANGTYKNIEDVLSGDRVINKDGKAVDVKRAFCTGEREVVSYRTNVGIGNTYCTSDHQHWVGDISTNKAIESTGYKRVLDQRSKTTPKQSKYKWKEIASCTSDNTVLLLPRQVNFELPKSFSIPLQKRIGGNNKHNIIYETYVTLEPCYDLGYMFGTFLGDGNSHCVEQKSGSRIGSVVWTFGKDEKDIANKLNNCILSIFSRETSSIKQLKNTWQVRFSDKPLADFLYGFGKKDKKAIPKELLVDHKDYLQGLFDGLVDSDGTVSKENRIGFVNTSKSLLELFCVLSMILYGHMPIISAKQKTTGNLSGCNPDNLKDAYACKLLQKPENRMTKEYQVVKIMERNEQPNKIKVYDLEIDDETHSFIANNVIVHNSVCITKNQTGVTFPQFSAVRKVCQAAKQLSRGKGWKIAVVADGGLYEYGDIAKAIGAGADMVMSGRFFATCKEAPGERIYNDSFNVVGKEYRGMASTAAMRTIKREEDMTTPEGIQKILSISGEQTVAQVMKEIQGALQSSFSYSNAENLWQFQEKVLFGVYAP